MKVLCLQFKNTPDLKNIAELFYSLTPKIAVRGNEAIFLDISKSHRPFSEEGFLKRILVILRKFKMAPRYALAEDAGTALAYCKFFTTKKSILPLAALQCYLEPFNMTSDYDGSFLKMVPHLERLGIKSVQDFLTLSPSSLPSRFGPVGLLLFMRLQIPDNLSWPTFVLADEVTEKLEFQEDWRMENVSILIFYLESLLDRAQMRLRAKGQQIKLFEVVFHQEKFSTGPDPRLKIKIDLSNSQVPAKSIMDLTKEKIDEALQKKPFLGIVASLELHVMGQSVYKPKSEGNLENWYDLLARLSLYLGQEPIFQTKPRASYLPERNWERTVSGNASSQIPWQTPTRPLRTLSSPERVNLHGDALHWAHETFEIAEVSHHELVLSEWWNDLMERVYFCAKTKSGEDLWLFRSTDGVFIHGYFD